MIKIDITKVTDHPDGTATIEFETDQNTLILLASIGMQTLIEVAAGKVLDGYPDAEGTEDGRAGEGGDQDLSKEIP
jgi:hypothetical protein